MDKSMQNHVLQTRRNLCKIFYMLVLTDLHAKGNFTGILYWLLNFLRDIYSHVTYLVNIHLKYLPGNGLPGNE